MTKKTALLGVAALVLLGACATSAPPAASVAPAPVAAPVPPPAPPAKIGAWGFDTAGIDTAVKPGDDFFEYSGGAWMAKQQIPADRTRWGAFDLLRAEAEEDVRQIITEIAAKGAPAATNEGKIANYYNAFMDTARIDELGLAPAKATLDAIAAAKTHADIARLIASPGLPTDGPIAAAVGLDDKNPDRYIVNIGHSGLGLPEREYYLKNTDEFKEIRAKYQAHIEKLLTLAGQTGAAAKAKRIVALETEIAKLHWEIAKRRERDLTYNLITLDQLKKEAPAYPWDVAFAEAGFGGEKEFVVAEWSAIPGLARLFQRTPVSTWREYVSYHFLSSAAAVLPTAIDNENFDFYGHTLNGQPMQRDRWKRAVQSLDGALGEAIGQEYVARHFTPDAKAKMVDLVENLRKGYAERIKTITWMTPETKVAALEKLAAFRPKIGYPDKWKDYSALEVKPGEAFANLIAAQKFEAAVDAARLGKPTDRDEWFMTPQTVNAYYNSTFNEIVFPAAILQPPFFDPNADPAVNYGAIGGVIGHEMGHGFDDQGAKSDAKGVLRTWWSKADEDAFKARTDALAAQYDEFEPLPELNINGRLTLGENIGDLGGLQVAHAAYLLSLDGQPAPVIDGYTADQRFFHGWGQVWRSLIRDQALRNQILTDPHSPAEFRVNGVVRNLDEWYAAFDVKPGDKLYLPPEQRVKIW